MIYFISFFIGYHYTVTNYTLSTHFVKPLRDLSAPVFETILINNLILIILLFTGSFLMGTTTVINLVHNGHSIGMLLSIYSKISSLAYFLSLTAPHGIFEIPAIIIAGAAGFKIPYEIIRYLAGRKEQILTKEDIKEYLTLALISIILIVIAAFVEAYITPRIAEYFLSSPVE